MALLGAMAMLWGIWEAFGPAWVGILFGGFVTFAGMLQLLGQSRERPSRPL